jgi:phenylacetate-CoA ligase
VDVDDLGARHSDLPLLFLYGRADDAVPYFGCKITPANVEEAVFSLPELEGRVGSFALLVSEDEQATKRLALALELREGAEPPANTARLRAAVLTPLAELNQDYREAARFMPAESLPTLELHAAGTGPFAGHDVRLKRRYVRRS